MTEVVAGEMDGGVTGLMPLELGEEVHKRVSTRVTGRVVRGVARRLSRGVTGRVIGGVNGVLV